MIEWFCENYQWVHKKVDAIIRKIIIFKKNSFYQKSTNMVLWKEKENLIKKSP